MKVINIRREIFETSSSSCHSIVICCDGNNVQKLLPDENGVIHIYGYWFNEERLTYYSSEIKASYCLVYAKRHKLLGACALEALKRCIEQKTGYSVVFEPAALLDDGPYWGNIDHQSADVAYQAFIDMEQLTNFIFNPLSILIIDTDNY